MFDIKFNSITAYCIPYVYGHIDQGRTLVEFKHGDCVLGDLMGLLMFIHLWVSLKSSASKLVSMITE